MSEKNRPIGRLANLLDHNSTVAWVRSLPLLIRDSVKPGWRYGSVLRTCDLTGRYTATQKKHAAKHLFITWLSNSQNVFTDF